MKGMIMAGIFIETYIIMIAFTESQTAYNGAFSIKTFLAIFIGMNVFFAYLIIMGGFLWAGV